MALFKRDATAALAKQRALLAADEAKIIELQRERAAKLLDADDNTEAVDRQIEAARRTVKIRHDPIAALDMQVRTEAAERRERTRDAAIKVIQKKLAAREAVALELEKSIKQTGDLFFQLIGSANISVDWPFGALPVNGLVDADAVRKEVGYALYSLSGAP